MRRLIIANALDWARQGRAQTLSDWIEALPQAMREADPWLEYWYGRAWIFVRPPRGRPALERAYEAFRAAGDLRGQALALNTIVTGYYYEWANFAPLDRWLPEFDRLLGPESAPKLDRESELRARAAHVIALLFRRPEDPELAVMRPPSRRAHRRRRRPQRADDGRLDAVQLSQLDDQGRLRRRRSSRGSSRSSPRPRSRR